MIELLNLVSLGFLLSCNASLNSPSSKTLLQVSLERIVYAVVASVNRKQGVDMPRSLFVSCRLQIFVLARVRVLSNVGLLLSPTYIRLGPTTGEILATVDQSIRYQVLNALI